MFVWVVSSVCVTKCVRMTIHWWVNEVCMMSFVGGIERGLELVWGGGWAGWGCPAGKVDDTKKPHILSWTFLKIGQTDFKYKHGPS